MPKVAYVATQFRPETLAMIGRVNAICAEYAAQGFSLTLRQLYYQLVSRGLIANKSTEYKRLGSIVNDARLAGLTDWAHIVDRTRNLRSLSQWETPLEIITESAEDFHHDLWKGQPYRPEVWIEKDALIGVIEPACQRNDVAHFSCRGYTSQSELWRAARRHRQHERTGQDVIVIHLGDHDPSGIDMTRDIQDRLDLFGSSARVRRIALTMDQVREHDPPPNPAKLTDSRANGYVRRFGRESWELDALDPATLDALVDEEIRSWRDEALWDAAVERQEQDRAELEAVRDRWDDVTALVRGTDPGNSGEG